MDSGNSVLRVVHFERCPMPGQHSIGRVFDNVRKGLPADIAAQPITCRFARSAAGRIWNVLSAACSSGAVFHITGDVHYLALGLPCRRTVLTIHDCTSLHRLSGVRRWAFKRLWYDWPVQRAAVVTTISQFAAEELCDCVPAACLKTRVVHNPVGADFQYARPRQMPARPVVLQVGTAPNKNLDRVVKALAGVPCHLRIIGRLTNQQMDLLARNAVEYSNVYDILARELVAEYRNCDLVLFASLYEGFGLPIVEGNAVGRPVITSTVCSMPEIAGDAACYVEPSDVSSIREGVLRVVSDGSYRNELIEHGIENVARFRLDRIGACYAEIYRQVAASR